MNISVHSLDPLIINGKEYTKYGVSQFVSGVLKEHKYPEKNNYSIVQPTFSWRTR